MKIWKYTLKVPSKPGEVQLIEMPEGAQMLSVMNQRENAVLYALMDPKARKVKRRVTMITAGQEFLPCEFRYVGLIELHRMNSEASVTCWWHVWVGGEEFGY